LAANEPNEGVPDELDELDELPELFEFVIR
jgi:hypothetical protein